MPRETRIITHVTKDDRDNIIEVGSAGTWREPAEAVIADIESVTPAFEYRAKGPDAHGSSAISVVNSRHGKYLRTHADKNRGNNLDLLPLLP